MVEVLGAGWAGLSVAWHLRDRGVPVRVVDPRGLFGGASGASLGVALPFTAELPHRLEAALGEGRARALITFGREGAATLPGFRPTGTRWIAGPHRDVAVAAAARLGLPHTATSDGFVLADGGVVDLEVLRGALAFDVHADRAPADVTVHATGWESGDGWLADKVMPVRWQATRFVGPRVDVPILAWQASVIWSGWLDVVGARWATPHLEVGETAAWVEPRVAAMQERLTREMFPETGAVERRWAAIVAESCDGLPFVGPIPGRPREIACMGFGVTGLPWAWRAGRAVADGLLGGTSPGLPAILSTGRFR